MKKLKTVAAQAAMLIAALVAGVAIGSQMRGESDKKVISEGMDIEFHDIAVGYFYEPTYAIAEPYPDMGENEKALFFESNKKFYEALERGGILVSPFILEYFYADNAGNNPVVLDVIESSRGGAIVIDEHGRPLRRGDQVIGETYVELAKIIYEGTTEQLILALKRSITYNLRSGMDLFIESLKGK